MTAHSISPPIWSRSKGIVLRRIPVRAIDIPESYERRELAEDDALFRSIKNNGVQQPVVVLQNGDRFTMVKGGRRLRLAEKAGIPDLLARIDTVPAGVEEKAYRDRLRFVLTNARQDLPPSQKASIVRQMMDWTKLSQKDVAALMGFDAGSVSNWLAIETYIPEIRRALDTRATTPHHARAFDGMNPEGQEHVYGALRKEIGRMSGDQFQALVRAKFPPAKFGHFYIDPQKMIEKLKVKARGRKKKRTPLTRDEKVALSQSVELAEIELEDLKTGNAKMRRECTLCGPLANAIMRNKTLREMLSPDMRDELARFVEIY